MDGFRQGRGTLPTEHFRNIRVISDCNNLAHMPSTIFRPVPHKKRMSAMVRIAPSVHLDVIRILRKLGFILLPQLETIFRVGKTAVKKLDVAGMEGRIKLVIA